MTDPQLWEWVKGCYGGHTGAVMKQLVLNNEEVNQEKPVLTSGQPFELFTYISPRDFAESLSTTPAAIEGAINILEADGWLHDLNYAPVRDETLGRTWMEAFFSLKPKWCSPTATWDSFQRRKVTPQVKQLVFDRDGHRCVSCVDHRDLCVDHMRPIVLGGDSRMDNLQTLCRSCNSSKRAKPLSKWLSETDHTAYEWSPHNDL